MQLRRKQVWELESVAQREILTKGEGAGSINCKTYRKSLVYFSHLATIDVFLLKGEVKIAGRGTMPP